MRPAEWPKGTDCNETKEGQNAILVGWSRRGNLIRDEESLQSDKIKKLLTNKICFINAAAYDSK